MIRKSWPARILVAMLGLLAGMAISAPGASAGTGEVQLEPVVYRVIDSPNPKASYEALSVNERATFDRSGRADSWPDRSSDRWYDCRCAVRYQLVLAGLGECQ